MMSLFRKLTGVIPSRSYTLTPAKGAELWEKIRAFELDDPEAVAPFSKRLADEEGWTMDQARRAVEEYKKFIYLAATSEHMVTPSKIVDKVWHFHLQYTESYWIELCAKILGRAIHHNPSTGSKKEEAKYQDHYLRTLEAYERAFGEPPADIWRREQRGVAGALVPEHQATALASQPGPNPVFELMI